MLSYRIESVTDKEGMVAVRVYSGADNEPLASSGHIFHSEGEAEDGIMTMIRHAWPDKEPFAVDASIGV